MKFLLTHSFFQTTSVHTKTLCFNTLCCSFFFFVSLIKLFTSEKAMWVIQEFSLIKFKHVIKPANLSLIRIRKTSACSSCAFVCTFLMKWNETAITFARPCVENDWSIQGELVPSHTLCVLHCAKSTGGRHCTTLNLFPRFFFTKRHRREERALGQKWLIK